MVIVDAHQHYWQIQNFEYPWHKEVNLPEMNRDYMPPDILPQMQALGIQYSVLIQADNSLAETAWMLDLARRYPHIAGVVGWVDLAAGDVAATLDNLAREPLFKGVRLMPVPTDDWHPLSHGLEALAARGMTCDVLPREGMLPLVIEMMRAQSATRFVVNHLAGLALTPGGAGPWTEQLRPLAALPNVSLKFSAIQGLAEPPPITAETLRPYLESALALFGAERLIFASDWPVSTLSGPYAEAINTMREVTAALSEHEQACIWGQTAIDTYRLTLRS
ncbi:MAG TPA: amidohydrolase family protein [Ktedonobacteraceae bacterium]|jgi:L-fuconolactonase|nr:amidohydrolase family protein [Ktedonobacteraceae bacterium]